MPHQVLQSREVLIRLSPATSDLFAKLSRFSATTGNAWRDTSKLAGDRTGANLIYR
jgi:hypothetical protein